jgi:hypothetical protein
MPLLASLLTAPPMVPLATCILRTHELSFGSEVVRRDGSSTYVIEVGLDGRHIWLQLADGTAGVFRRGRRWRVIAPPVDVAVPFLSAPL